MREIIEILLLLCVWLFLAKYILPKMGISS